MLTGRSAVWGGAILALLLIMATPRAALGLPPPARISVLTMGAGDHPFTRFGHNALLLEWDSAAPADARVYNFGTFAFDGIEGARDFMTGHFRYWLSVTSLPATLRSYAAAGRSLRAQELELTRAERAELYRRLEDNARPEHRYYDYDYYRDNCSTRVRDALDQLLGGELERQVAGPGRLTFRQHTLRLVDDSPWLYGGLDLALGAPTDRPTTRWQELFLPDELHAALAHATRTFEGRRVALVRRETVLLPGDPRNQPAEFAEHRARFAAVGALLGALLVGLGFAAARSRGARVCFGAVTATLGTALGALGTALLVFSLSKHWAAHQNASIWACPPWALSLALLGARYAWSPARSTPPLLAVLAASLASCLTLVFLSLTGWLGVSHGAIREGLLFTPIWLGWLSGTWVSRARKASLTP